MIVRSMPMGCSFKWLTTYLTTDPKAQTAERVAFTHTINLAYDDVGSAVDTMLHTYRDRDLLKAEAGIRRGGSSVEKPVKHVSLAWHVSERPTQAVMIEAATSYLRAMGWQDHECLVVGHTDKKHPHIHLMINVIHPERGTRLNDSYERRRAQNWALDYERARGQIWCPERLKPVAEREPSPPRNVWEWLKAIDDPGRMGIGSTSHPSKIEYDAPSRQWRGEEWQHLKQQQKEERLAFFDGGKAAYRAARLQAYRDVRATYRRDWADLHALRRAGAPKMLVAEVRAAIADRQTVSLTESAKRAAQDLRHARDDAYRALLEGQKVARAELIDWQEQGFISPHLVQPIPGRATSETAQAASPPPATAPSPSVPSPTAPAWAAQAGMVAQQRSANRWLDRAVDRLARAAVAPQPESGRGRLAAAHERLQKETTQPDKSVRVPGIGPDR